MGTRRVQIYTNRYIGDAYMSTSGSNYGCLSFIGDVVMTLLTGGLWLIWVFVREMQRR